jgi:diaminopimelate decarboxylase
MSRPLDFFKYERDSELSVAGVPLSRIAEQVGTPVYVYSAEAFLRPLRELQDGLKSLDHVVCFAVKSNSNISILKMLHHAGAGMDLVSGGELYRAGLAGVPGSKIVFSGVGKTRAEMEQALAYDGGKGIFSFNVESVAELKLLSETARAQGRVAPVALRFNPDVNPKTHPYISTGLKKNKFGVRKPEILEIARNLGDYPGIEFRGLSVHIGSQLLSLSPLNDAFKLARALMDELNEILPKPLSFMDIGGGVGITYKNEKSPEIAAYTKIVHKHFGAKSKLKHPVKLLLEPGRRISGNSGVLLSRVLFRKERKEKDFLVVDAAMNDLMRPSLYGSYHEIVPVRRPTAKATSKKTDIVGPVCESGDCFASDRAIPRALGSGDLVAILSSGAYGFTMASNYNSRPRPAEVLVDRGSFRVIRERESIEDLVRGERLV